MKKSDCAVFILSSRKFLLIKCLNEFWKNFNKDYDFPVYIYYFTGVYDKEYTNFVKKENNNRIKFIEIFPKIPSHLNTKDLFYNRKYNPYVRKHFNSDKRLGYLYMNRFTSNLTSYDEYGCITSDLKKYDYLMRIDDDSWFKKKINFNLFDSVKSHPIATGYTWNYINSNILHTRENLWNFYIDYIKKNNIKPKNEILLKAVNENDENQMHKLLWTAGNCNLYNIKMINNSDWKKFIKAVNENGGQFKYRWTDLEVIGLYAYTYFDNPIYDLKIKENGFYENKFNNFIYYYLSATAPAGKKKLNLNFIIFKLYKFFYPLTKYFKKA